MKSQCKLSFWASAFKIIAYAGFYDGFRALFIKCVAIEHGFQAKPEQTLFDQSETQI